MEDIAIFGMGISGSAVLTSYAKELKDKKHAITIDCYDTSHSFGRGVPFREDSDLALVNTRTTDITYDYEQPGEYEHWLKEEAKIEGDIPEFTTRALFGEYLNDRTMKQIELLNATIHYETIEDMQWLSETKQWELVTDSNEVRQYDRVHLCSGSLPVLDPYNLNGKPNYISNPYPLNELTHNIFKDDRFVVIGTRLTAIDVLKYLLQERENESVYTFSRHNFFNTVGTANLAKGKLPMKSAEAIIEGEDRGQITILKDVENVD